MLRIEDLDLQRCRPEFDAALIEDLRWLGIAWDEGPDIGGPYAPYRQTERMPLYRDALRRLAATGAIYPCRCTRRDAAQALAAPHPGEAGAPRVDPCRPLEPISRGTDLPSGVNWRLFTSPDEVVTFEDKRVGPQQFSRRDFGDFIVWRKDDLPAYQLSVVVDDAAMGITEVVRGDDLLPSTAQQLLLYRALGFEPPGFYHCPLVKNADGTRLAKRTGVHSLRALRAAGVDPDSLLSRDGIEAAL